MNIRQLAEAKLRELGADGLYWHGGGESCGCLLADLAPCGEPNWEECVAAKKGADGLMYPMEVENGNNSGTG